MNKNNIYLILCLLSLALIFYFGFIYEKQPDWSGMPAQFEPIQKNIKNSTFFIHEKDFIITPLADYEITGIVISTKRYFFDATSSISPIDIVIAWKKMSVADVIKDMKFKHRNRAVIYSPKKEYWPITEKEVMVSLSNNHCIAANKEIKKQLFKIKKYDLVTLEGQLVSVEKKGMQPWVSSLSRDDGPGWGKLIGCEIIYVTNVKIRKP